MTTKFTPPPLRVNANGKYEIDQPVILDVEPIVADLQQSRADPRNQPIPPFNGLAYFLLKKTKTILDSHPRDPYFDKGRTLVQQISHVPCGGGGKGVYWQIRLEFEQRPFLKLTFFNPLFERFLSNKTTDLVLLHKNAHLTDQG